MTVPGHKRQIYETGEEVKRQPYPKSRRIRNSAAKKAVRKPYCEHCGGKAYGGAHHILSQAAGGPDHPWNLIQLCYSCHVEGAHRGLIDKRTLFAIVAKREGLGVDELIDAVYEMRRTGTPVGQHG